MYKKNIYKYNIIVIIIAILMHYLINPAESESVPAIPKLIHIFSGVILILIFYSITNYKISHKIITPFLIIGLLFFMENSNGHINQGAQIIINIGISFAIATYYYYELDGFEFISRGIDFLLIFWVSLLCIQLIFYVISSNLIEFHLFFHPYSESRVHDLGYLIRLNGVQNEPGTYSNWVFGLVIIRGLKGNKLFDLISLLSIISITITLSVWGINIGFLYLCVFIVNKLIHEKLNLKNIALVFVIFSSFLLLYSFSDSNIGDQILNYIEFRSNLNDDSSGTKIDSWNGFRNIYQNLLFYGNPISYDFCGGCDSPNDIGIFINLTVYGGFILSIYLFSIIFIGISKLYNIYTSILLGAPLLFTKYYFTEPIFWIIFGYCYLVVHQKKSYIRSRGN